MMAGRPLPQVDTGQTKRADRQNRTAYGKPIPLSKEREEGEYRGKLGEERGVTMRASALQGRRGRDIRAKEKEQGRRVGQKQSGVDSAAALLCSCEAGSETASDEGSRMLDQSQRYRRALRSMARARRRGMAS